MDELLKPETVWQTDEVRTAEISSVNTLCGTHTYIQLSGAKHRDVMS